MNLKELFEKHGQKWLALQNAPHIRKFKPLGVSENNQLIIGEYHREGYAKHNSYGWDYPDFILYQEPNPNVLRWQYVVKYTEQKMPFIRDSLFRDEDEFRQFTDMSEVEWFKKLEPPIECES